MQYHRTKDFSVPLRYLLVSELISCPGELLKGFCRTHPSLPPCTTDSSLTRRRNRICSPRCLRGRSADWETTAQPTRDYLSILLAVRAGLDPLSRGQDSRTRGRVSISEADSCPRRMREYRHGSSITARESLNRSLAARKLTHRHRMLREKPVCAGD